MNFQNQLFSLIDSHELIHEKILPSKWAEQNRSMASENSPWPGKFNWDRTPYMREILDCISPDHAARIIAIMKGAQIGCSTAVMENAIGWIIAQNPGAIYFLTGDKELSAQAMNLKIDQMIQSCGLSYLIGPHVIRKKNQRTGDTSSSKEFPGGTLIAGATQNANKLRQTSVQFGFIDDFESAPINDKKAGSITTLIEQRFAAYYTKMKLYYISTPELKHFSNIENVYLLGDQRKYLVPCPRCGTFIHLQWNIKMDGKDNAGIYFQVDDFNKVINDSVGYVCQECAQFFTDGSKHEMNLNGDWNPTAQPSELGYYSYHISSLYAPVGMYDWAHYARKFNQAFPKQGGVKKGELKTFYNVVLALTWEEFGKSPKASKLAMNKRPYKIGTLPENCSNLDGNGNIILITCGSDMNGFVDDARLDYEIVAWTESGSSYSIMHGSIGTFIPREGKKKVKVDREKWTYTLGTENCVWPEFEKIITQKFTKENGMELPVMITGLDVGHLKQEAHTFLDMSNRYVIGLRGRDENKVRKIGTDTLSYRPSKERGDVFLVEVNQIKDELADLINLKWHNPGDSIQPPGFMNFPLSEGGLYEMSNFFSHFESEHRKMAENTEGIQIGSKWEKKSSASQNHLWDCRVYNMVLKELVASMLCKESKIPYTWKNYVDLITGKLNQ
jgi:phage terminase large subunit GpA-like protein